MLNNAAGKAARLIERIVRYGVVRGAAAVAIAALSLTSVEAQSPLTTQMVTPTVVEWGGQGSDVFLAVGFTPTNGVNAAGIRSGSSAVLLRYSANLALAGSTTIAAPVPGEGVLESAKYVFDGGGNLAFVLTITGRFRSSTGSILGAVSERRQYAGYANAAGSVRWYRDLGELVVDDLSVTGSAVFLSGLLPLADSPLSVPPDVRTVRQYSTTGALLKDDSLYVAQANSFDTLSLSFGSNEPGVYHYFNQTLPALEPHDITEVETYRPAGRGTSYSMDRTVTPPPGYTRVDEAPMMKIGASKDSYLALENKRVPCTAQHIDCQVLGSPAPVPAMGIDIVRSSPFDALVWNRRLTGDDLAQAAAALSPNEAFSVFFRAAKPITYGSSRITPPAGAPSYYELPHSRWGANGVLRRIAFPRTIDGVNGASVSASGKRAVVGSFFAGDNRQAFVATYW